MIDRLGNPAASSPRPVPRRTCPSRHGTRRGSHGVPRRAGRLDRSAVQRAGDDASLPAVERLTIVTRGMVGEAELGGRWQDAASTGLASARARWPAAMARSYAPLVRNGGQKERPGPADASRRGPRRGSRPRAEVARIRPVHERQRQCAGRAGDRWPARRVAVLRQMWRAASACSKYPTASR